jgi:hypothetical protein
MATHDGVTESVTTGKIVWLGHVIACWECGVQAPWTLTTVRLAGVDGELAWAQCANGHRGQHPLVYPEFVHLVAGWARDVERYGKAYQQDHRGWEPHWLSWSEQGSPRYCHWTTPGPVEWNSAWPELVKASTLPARIAEWSRTTAGTGFPHVWINAWGTIEPDRRHVELVP